MTRWSATESRPTGEAVAVQPAPPPPLGTRVSGADPAPEWFSRLYVAFAQVGGLDEATRRAVTERDIMVWATVRSGRASARWLSRKLGLSHSRINQMVAAGELASTQRGLDADVVAERVYGR